MPSKKITVQIMSPGILEDDILVLGDMLIKQWKIPTHLPLLLAFGSFRHRVKVIPLSRSDGVRMSSGLARKWEFNRGRRCDSSTGRIPRPFNWVRC